MHKQSTKKLIFAGVAFILLGLLFNVPVLSMLLSRDGISSIHSKIGIWIVEAFCVLAGILIILGRRRIASFYQQAHREPKHMVFLGISVVLFCLTVFLVPEILLRFLKPQPTYSRLVKMVKAGIYAESPFNPFTLKANVVTTAPSMEHPGKSVTVTINSLGLRGGGITLPKPPGVERVLVLGDSYTYGVYVGDHETYSAVLQDLLTENGKGVQVINAGYADGWAPDEHYAWLVNRGLDFRPDVIIYGFFIGNDLTDTMDLNWSDLDERGLPTKILNPKIRIDENGVLRSSQEDQRTVGADGIYRMPLLRESHLLVFLSNRFKSLFQRKTGGPLDRGWGKDPFPFIFKMSNDPEMELQEKRFKKLVLGMSEAAKDNNAKFLLLMIPINFQVDEDFMSVVLGDGTFGEQREYFDEIKPWLEMNHIEYLDLLKVMKKEGGAYYPENGEVHFNPHGHYFTAQMIKRALDQLGWL